MIGDSQLCRESRRGRQLKSCERSKARAFCLPVRGFVSPPIGQALNVDPAKGFVGTQLVVDAEVRAVAVAEIELCAMAA